MDRKDLRQNPQGHLKEICTGGRVSSLEKLMRSDWIFDGALQRVDYH
jgi:hypothetical protein